jgi:hypothetical protein
MTRFSFRFNWTFSQHMKLLHRCGVAMSLASILRVSTGVTQDSGVKTRHLIDPSSVCGSAFANRAFFDFDPNHKVLQFWYETPSAMSIAKKLETRRQVSRVAVRRFDAHLFCITAVGRL